MNWLVTATAVACVAFTTAAAAPPKAPLRKAAAKPARPIQGFRCATPATSGDAKAVPAGAAEVKTLTLTRLKRPTPTSAILRVAATVSAPKDAELYYTYSTTGGGVTGDGPSVTWTLDAAGTWTISLELYNRTSGCSTFTSATYTIREPGRGRAKTPAATKPLVK